MNERGRDPRFSPLKAGWRAVVDELGGVAVMARADVTRVGAALLSRYGLIHESCFVPVDVALECEQAAVRAGGRPHLLAAYADALGFVLVPKAEAEAQQPNFTKHLGEVARETGDVMAHLGEAIGDGVVSAAEAERVRMEVRDAAERLACLDKDLATVAGGTVTPMVRRA
jgi:hypothetical protein